MACILKQNLSYWRNIDCNGVRIVHTGMYSPFAYALAQFLWFIYFTFFIVLYFTYYGMMLVAISSNLSISSMTTSVPNSILNLLPGFVIPKIFVLIMAEDNSVVNMEYLGMPICMLENGEMMEECLRNYFGFRHDFLWVVAAIVLGFSLLYSFIFSYGIKTLNIQTR
ncbi:hypothetical protein V2J09_013707 [Rumex salicifolius]